MRARIVLAVVGLLALAASALAQSTTGTISGRVLDGQGLAVPGANITATSPNLQGVRETVTSGNGDYILALLPPGAYTIAISLPGFETQMRSVVLAPTQVLPVDVTLGVGTLTEKVTVEGRIADPLTRTAQVATNIPQTLLAALPTNRDINAAVLQASAVHATGPAGAYSIAGSMSFENLFLVNGVTVNENLRGQPNTLFIEDAIQETTVATAGISAEFGRFSGGVVNVVTKSGGNLFTGSFRDTLHNDNWRELVPNRPGDTFTTDTKLDRTVPTYEYTFGGPIIKDRLWFFTAGRFQTQELSRQLIQTNIPYAFTQKSKRFEFNSSFSLTSNHKLSGAYIKESLDQINNTFDVSLSMDLRSLENRQTPQDLTTFNYTGILGDNLSIEGRYSRRNFTFVGSGANSTDIIDGTLVTDRQRNGLRYWAATFCGVCTPEERDNEDIYVKGTYFLSRKGAGSHTVVVGYDNFDDIRKANNRQSGSDYRILGTTSIISGTSIAPVFLGDGTTIIQWNPIPILSEGSHFRTHSVFANDAWRINDRLTANLGIRYDKNDGKNQAGESVIRDSAISPRLGLIWDPTGTGQWTVTGGVGRYVAAVSLSVADQSSAAGNSQTWPYLYLGPNINGGGVAEVDTATAIRQVFNWFEAASGCKVQVDTCRPNLPTNGNPTIPGVATKIGTDLVSPNNLEYSLGVSRNVGDHTTLRADYVFRDYRDMYALRTDASTGTVTNSVGQRFDLTFVENTNVYSRQYQGVTFQGTYRRAASAFGVNYTVSRLWGNFDGETVNGGPTAGTALQYPEYKQASWNYPEGDLGADQRHRARLWLNYAVPLAAGLTVGLVETLESGIPYSASATSGVTIPAIAGTDYISPPSGTQTTYFFGPRDQFRTEGQRRTDLSINYDYKLGGARRVGLFVQGQVLNLFNQLQLCGCGNNVFSNGGAAQARYIDQTVRTNVTTAAAYATFNPFTTTPVQGTHWDFGPAFGHANNRLAYTTPRMFRMTFGVRF
jgi:outer membrane receptor for ferrienterochelin and colicin